MKGERAFAPLILTAVVLAFAQQWPQALWGWIYSHVHYNDVGFIASQGTSNTSNTSGQLTNLSPNAAPAPFGETYNPVLKQWINNPAPGTFSSP